MSAGAGEISGEAPHPPTHGRTRLATGSRRSGPPAQLAGADRARVIADAIRIAAWLSIAAGLIHAMAMVDHFGHWWAYGVFFVVLTCGQVLWGVMLLRGHESDRALLIGAIANLAIVAVWLFSRTIVVAVGPEAGTTEPFGVMDVAVTLDQLVLIACVAAILRPRLLVSRGFRTLLGVHRIRFAVMVASATVFAALLGGHQH